MAKFSVILPAAGTSSRFTASQNETHLKKPFANLKNQSVWLYSAQKFLDRKDVGQLIIVISSEDEEFFRMKFSANIAVLGLTLVCGGPTRVESVRNAIHEVSDDCDYIAIHDAARPCLQDSWIDGVFAQAQRNGAAILATPIVGTVKRVDSQTRKISQTVPRTGLWQAQTPQVFEKNLLRKAYAQFEGNATDDSQVVEAAGHAVDVVQCPNTNLKITTRDDLKLAEGILRAAPKKNILAEMSSPPTKKSGTLDDLFS
ncbi:MAG: 2-C-methyl-D-erythritol 4-phosphate cytidylyltransferase [Planctomycetota bacterium]|nr:2-C-methyl-D-erythritol 4-phosphate cytidylyltransferase [Planctomycetota bacterium]